MLSNAEGVRPYHRIGAGDATTLSIVPAGATLHGKIIAKQGGIIAGLDVARAVFQALDPAVAMETLVAEGEWVTDRQALAHLAGPARAALTGEHTALNFLGRLPGSATQTRRFVDAVAGTRAQILDTRKTAPGLRALDKLAARRHPGLAARLRPGRHLAAHRGRERRLAGGILQPIRPDRGHSRALLNRG